jgi:hypothetical protein
LKPVLPHVTSFTGVQHILGEKSVRQNGNGRAILNRLAEALTTIERGVVITASEKADIGPTERLEHPGR